MSTLLRVDASVRTTGSIGRAVADSATAAWLADHPSGVVVRRDLGAAPLPADAWASGVTATYLPEQQWTESQRRAKALAATLADELLASDVLVLASPLYNFGVSQYTKTWIDLLITDPRLGPGSTALAGKDVLLVVAQGGGYREGTPRHGWDHATPYLERVFRDSFGMSVDTVLADLTLADTKPAMAHLREAAAAALERAHADAVAHGARLGRSGRAAA